MRSDLMRRYKITFVCIKVTTTEFLMRRSIGTTRGHPYKLYKQHSRLPVALIVLHSTLNVYVV